MYIFISGAACFGSLVVRGGEYKAASVHQNMVTGECNHQGVVYTRVISSPERVPNQIRLPNRGRFPNDGHQILTH
jgi:hypothetical protein